MKSTRLIRAVGKSMLMTGIILFMLLNLFMILFFIGVMIGGWA